MVGVTGLEPVWMLLRGIFLLLYVTIADWYRCSLDSLFTMPHCGLGSRCIASTHFWSLTLRIGTGFCWHIPRLGDFYSKGFPKGTPHSFLWYTWFYPSSQQQVPCVCQFHHTPIFSEYVLILFSMYLSEDSPSVRVPNVFPLCQLFPVIN